MICVWHTVCTRTSLVLKHCRVRRRRALGSCQSVNVDWGEAGLKRPLVFIASNSPFAADLNLIAQIIVLALLLAGAILAKSSEFKIHGRVMIAAIFFQFAAVFSWMLLSLIINLGALGFWRSWHRGLP